MKTGRNDPCPCGSGKKYKRCCGASGTAEKIIPFPGTPESRFETGIPSAFNHYSGVPGTILPDTGRMLPGSLEPWKTGPGPAAGDYPPTLMEQRGTPNTATDFLHELRTISESKNFASLDEMKAFMNEYVEKRQKAPVDDFLGISPDLMHRILSGDRSLSGSFVSLKKGLSLPDLESSPLLKTAVFILRAIQPGPLKTTSAGYVPTSLIKAWWEQRAEYEEPNERLRELFRPKKEMEAWEFWQCRLQLMTERLIVLEGQYLALTRKGQKIIDTMDLDALFGHLFQAVCWSWDWNTIRDDYRSFLEISRQSFLFTLHLLNQTAQEWISPDNLVEACLRAFPTLRRNFQETDNPDFHFHDPSLGAGIIYWPKLLGFLEVRGGYFEKRQENAMPQPEEYRVTALFNRLVKISVR